jgi:hypothetical protein
LERLWKSAKRLEPAELLAKPKRISAVKPAASKTATATPTAGKKPVQPAARKKRA